MRDIAESDWKKFSKLRPVALERLSQRILEDCAVLCQDTSRPAHERYLELYRLIHERDKDIAAVFNDFRRSTAELRLSQMVQLDLVSDEELEPFGPELQAYARKWRGR
ncbi:hypothetical protein NG726_13975 [Pseudomonas sp. MOB-449]|nr:hypothetical protein [Pseudomonas sp. MOB-449]